MKQTTLFRSICVPLVLLVSVLLTLTTGTLAQAKGNPNPGILPPNSTPFGLTYGQWNARWWQWALGQPKSTNPVLDTTGEFCATGQKGKVWFLAGMLTSDQPGSGTAVRSCTIPTGKAIFFPIANAFYIADAGETAEIAQQKAQEAVDTATDLSAEIDGVPVEEISRYRIKPPLPIFNFTFPLDNVYDLTQAEVEFYNNQPASADGYYLMLAPLSRGTHEIHLHAVFPGTYPIDVTYHLNVARVP